MTKFLLVASDFSGLAGEAFFLFFLVLIVLILAIAGTFLALRKKKVPEERKSAEEKPKFVDSMWQVLAWLSLVFGSLGITLITDAPLHELLFSRGLPIQKTLPSILIVAVGIVFCLLAQRNAGRAWVKALMWLMILWFGYLAAALGLAILRG
jgi:ABC-type dipeptide/oligopeptide/nickel transport system permease component